MQNDQLARELEALSSGGAANLNDFGLFVTRNLSAILAALKQPPADVVEALRPFARFANNIPANFADDRTVSVGIRLKPDELSDGATSGSLIVSLDGLTVRHWRAAAAALAAIQPASADGEVAGLVERLRDVPPRAYLYQFSDPVSGKPVWRNSSGPWNGQTPRQTEALYSVEQIAAAIRAGEQA